MTVEIKYVSTVAIIGESGDDGSIKAKFHYTGPTGPDRTRADPHGPERSFSETRAAKKSVRVRSGPVGPV